MLVLTRRRGEAIVVGDTIEVRVLELTRHQVKLGIQAPRSVPVFRKEIYGRPRAADKPADPEHDTEVLGAGRLRDP